MQEKLDVAQHDSQEKDQKCSKLEDDVYVMKKMSVSKDDYEKQQELLMKLQQNSKYTSCDVGGVFMHV